MTLFICVDDGLGLAFNGRRQSRDSIVCADILNSCGELTVSSYSAPLFDGAKVRVDDKLGGEAVFAEREDAAELAGKAEKLVIYNWNRRYPADVRLPQRAEELGFSLAERAEFAGSSHEKIVKEIYIRR